MTGYALEGKRLEGDGAGFACEGGNRKWGGNGYLLWKPKQSGIEERK